MPTVKNKQRVYGIYAGDFQIRTPQDQGPVQNAAFDKGIITVSLRSLYADAASPASAVALMKNAWRFVPDPTAFTGVVGMGDYLDMGCEQEVDLFRIVVAQMIAEDPRLAFELLLPGNHDGGQLMGTVWSTKNFFNILGYVYPDFILDSMTGACGEADLIEERHEMVRELDAMVRMAQDPDRKPFKEVVEHVKHGNGRRYRTEDNDRLSFKKHARRIFDEIWHETPDANRWDAVIHYDRMLFDGHHDDEDDDETGLRDNPFRKIKEFGHIRGDVKQWVHLQARLQAEFALNGGGTMPVYEVALDTMDFTHKSDFSGAILGHVSPFQVALVMNFLDAMRQRNRNAKFKIVMHFPVDELDVCSRRALKKLLERPEVILLVDAHMHERGYDDDVRDELNIKRRTALACVSVPSTIDMPREVVLEEMSFDELGGKGKIEFDFRYIGLDEKQIPGADPVVFQALEKFEERVHVIKGELGVKDDFAYLNEDQVIEGFDPQLTRLSASHVSNRMRIKVVLSIIFRLFGRASRKLVAQASIPQTEADFTYFLEFLKILAELLASQHPGLAEELNAKIAAMQAHFTAWQYSYHRRRDQKYPDSGLKIMNSLYTDANLDEVVTFLNERIPADSHARAYLLIAAMRASAEEQKYHGFAETPVAEQMSTTAGFTLQPAP